MRVARFDDLPGLTFDVAKKGLVERAWCLRCGHGFVPHGPMNAKSVWTNAQKTKHILEGCDATGSESFTVLTPAA